MIDCRSCIHFYENEFLDDEAVGFCSVTTVFMTWDDIEKFETLEDIKNFCYEYEGEDECVF